MDKQELIELIDILDRSEVHIKNEKEILVFIDFDNLDKFTQILGIEAFNTVSCVLRDKYVVVNLIDINILDHEEIELIKNRYKAEEE